MILRDFSVDSVAVFAAAIVDLRGDLSAKDSAAVPVMDLGRLCLFGFYGCLGSWKVFWEYFEPLECSPG